MVYASEVKTASLVADGPYRRVRNPLYFANVLLAIGMGAMMSRVGFFVAIVAMVVFCYRLIFREESELAVSQGEQYERYQNAVPRLWPALRRALRPPGGQARWTDGFKAEFWCWGFAIAVAAFAINSEHHRVLRDPGGKHRFAVVVHVAIRKKTRGAAPPIPSARLNCSGPESSDFGW